MTNQVTPSQWEEIFNEAFEHYVAQRKFKRNADIDSENKWYMLGWYLSTFSTREPADVLRGFAEGLLHADFFDGAEHIRAELSPMLKDSWYFKQLVGVFSQEFEVEDD